MANGTPRQFIDVAVIGGGIAGAYSCWRLKQGGRQPVLFEMSNRIGGRLLSVTPPGMPDLTGELGGMRFLSVQQVVSSLVNYLGLPTADFPMGGSSNLATLRGKVLTDAEFSNPSMVPYNLLPQEQGKNPGQLLVGAISTIVPNATNLSPQEWEIAKQTIMWNGDHLYNWGLWNVLMSINNTATGQPPVLSSEAYALLYDGGGYESLVDNWNCAEACEYLLIDFPSDAKYYKLPQGYDTLPKTLAAQFVAEGGTINMNYRLRTFEPIMNLRGQWAVNLDVEDVTTGQMYYYEANALILAMPKRSLELVAETTPWLQSMAPVFDTVMTMPAYKTLLAYPTPWWQSTLDLTAGRSTTDLPIRQVYYLGTENAPNTNSLLLASYADGRSESFWGPLWGPPEFSYRRKNTFVDVPGGRPHQAPVAPPDVVSTVQQLLAQMHGLPLGSIPEPYFAAHMDWTEDPYGGGWHFWRAGVKVWETMPLIRHPIQMFPIFICGEAYGNEQGWAEGALTSAEHVMQDNFGLSWPSWLPSTYYLGP